MPQRLNPDCPSPTHQSMSSVRYKPSCTCPGLHHEAFELFKQSENAKRAAYRAVHGVALPEDSVCAPDFYSPAVPEPTYQAGRFEMDFQERDDLLCRAEDPELFYPIGARWGGDGNKFQEATAKAVCRRCPAVDDCLTFALRVGDGWAVLGGTTAAERRQMRKAMAGWAA